MAGPVAIAIGMAQLGEEAQALEPVRRLFDQLFGNLARRLPFAGDIERLCFRQPDIGIARIDRQGRVDPRQRIGLAALDRDACAPVKPARMGGIEREAAVIPDGGFGRMACLPFGSRRRKIE